MRRFIVAGSLLKGAAGLRLLDGCRTAGFDDDETSVRAYRTMRKALPAGALPGGRRPGRRPGGGQGPQRSGGDRRGRPDLGPGLCGPPAADPPGHRRARDRGRDRPPAPALWSRPRQLRADRRRRSARSPAPRPCLVGENPAGRPGGHGFRLHGARVQLRPDPYGRGGTAQRGAERPLCRRAGGPGNRPGNDPRRHRGAHRGRGRARL